MQPIRILTPSFQFLGEIDDYESLQFIRRFRKPGEFELHINMNKNLTETLQEDNLVFLSPRKVGVILHRELSRDNTEQLVVKGYTLQGILSRRITVPPVGQAYDKIKANAETVLKHYVRQNAVEPADPNRIIPNLVIADDLQRGLIVDWQSRFKNLVDELESISFSAGIGWDVFLDLQQQKWVFEVYVPRNLTTSQNTLPPVIFSVDFDNIKNQTFTDSAINYKNYGYIGGQGEGEDRAVVEVGNASGLSRIETFIDARDIEEGENLTTRGQQKLQEMQKILSFESEILTYGPFVYEKDWDLGDIVTVQDKKWGITLDTPITEIKEIYEPGGFRLEATFGNTVPTLIERIKKTIDVPMVEKPIKTSVPTKLSELENDAGYITIDDIPQQQPFIHEQLSPSNLWVINHNLSKYPSVTVTDSAGNVVIGDVKHVSLNTTEISFSAAFAGKAILV
ncbi:siphovirus ReqiPepy6 Gp37-like family protein [Geobacillus stearothermophilus]|nr:siphovirus ReqiPepy6 Gp37-like family protein [Geobacillus stearothermophilus]